MAKKSDKGSKKAAKAGGPKKQAVKRQHAPKRPEKKAAADQAPKTVANEEPEEVEVDEEDLEFAEEHGAFLESFVQRFQADDLALQKKGADDKKALRRQQKRQKEKEEQKAREHQAVAAAVGEAAAAAAAKQPAGGDGEGGGGDAGGEEERQAKKARRRRARDDDELRVASTKGWQRQQQDEDQGPVKERLPIKTVEGRVIRQVERIARPADKEEEEQQQQQEQEGEKKQEGGPEEGEDEESEDEDEDEDESDGEGLLDEEVVMPRPSAEGVTNVSASVEGSLAALQQQHGGGLDVLAMRQARLELKKVEIATLCEAVLEDPEGSAMTKTEGSRTRLQQLLTLLEDGDKRVQELGMISLLAVFKDVLPSYRIRLPTEKELAQKVSKDVKRLRDYERALLAAYQAYLKHLERTSKLGGSSDKARARVAVRCLCDLLPAMAHFNFSTNILSAVVALAMATADPDTRHACCHAITRLLQTDAQGEMSLAAAKLISQEVKARRLVAPEEVVRVLAHLKLTVREDDADAAKRKAAAQARGARGKKRKDKEAEEGEEGSKVVVDEAEIVAGLREAEARADPVVRARCQAEALQEVTLLYFRVLKQTSGRPVLLPAALEGLAKVAHLINLETVQDVIEVLRDLLDRDNDTDASAQQASSGNQQQSMRRPLPLHACLNAVLTALRTLQGPGRELKVDDRAFVVYLYRQLARLSELRGGRQLPLVITCVRAALLERREYSMARVAAFYKRLVSLALAMADAREARALLALARELGSRYGEAAGLDRLLEGEADRVSMGQYRPDVQDPELCNPFASACWELPLMRLHAHDGVRRAAAEMAAGSGVVKVGGAMAIAGEEEEVVVKGFGGWFKRLPRANPLHTMVRKSEKERRAGRPAKPFFIRKATAEASSSSSSSSSSCLPSLSSLLLPMSNEEEGDAAAPSFRPFFREAMRHERRLRLHKELARARAVKRAWQQWQQQQQKQQQQKQQQQPKRQRRK